MTTQTQPIGLYVHVPFCEQKCAYCDFFTVTDPDREHPLFNSWLDICLQELQLWRRDFPQLAGRPVQTIFFGGGTPSLLAPEQFARFIDGVRSGPAGLATDAEISLETQPATLAADDYRSLVDAGINRFSVGVQTFDEALLQPTARRHTVKDSEDTLRRARATGAVLSLDMICALPGQTMEGWRADLERALSFDPHHVSVYEMTYHAGTEYFRQWKRGRILQAEEELRVKMFRHTRARLTGAGYRHYEISNYARPGFESRHNRIYWTLGDFIGLGAGAHSYVGGRRYANPRSAEAYARTVATDNMFTRPHDSEDPDVTLVENLQMALRLTEGVDLDLLAQKLGQDIRITRRRQIDELQDRGWIVREGEQLRLSPEGQLFADGVAEYFL